MEFAREEDATVMGDNLFEKEKTKFRRLVLGSCKLLDNKLEKNGTYEFIPGVRLLLELTYIYLERRTVLRVRQLEGGSCSGVGGNGQVHIQSSKGRSSS